MLRQTKVNGILVRGYGVASEPSKDYPYGALDRQRPLFKERGLDLGEYFNGTLNINISPRSFRMLHPQFTFRQVRWTDLHPPEDFSFSACSVLFGGREYDGWIYYPHPETKRRNFQDPSLLEVICPFIAGLTPGSNLRVCVDPQRLTLHREGQD